MQLEEFGNKYCHISMAGDKPKRCEMTMCVAFRSYKHEDDDVTDYWCAALDGD